jgi:hypothetical protein
MCSLPQWCRHVDEVRRRNQPADVKRAGRASPSHPASPSLTGSSRNSPWLPKGIKIPERIGSVEFIQSMLDAIDHWMNHRSARPRAALAYYSVFSIGSVPN